VPILGIVENMAVHVCLELRPRRAHIRRRRGQRMAANTVSSTSAAAAGDVDREQADSGHPTWWPTRGEIAAVYRLVARRWR